MASLPRHNRKAFTLLEVLLALVITIALSSTLAIMWGRQNEINQARAIAYRQAEILAAANQYITANFETLMTDAGAAGGPIAIPAGRTTVGGAQPTGSDGLPSLQQSGYLGSQFVDNDRWRQHHWLIVRQGAINANSLEGVVVSSAGETIPDRVLGQAVQFIGADGGYIPNAPLPGQNGLILGATGGWTANVADFTVASFVTPTSGRLAAWIASAPAQILGDYLWRTDIGVPEANRMHTSIDVAKHELDHVSQITGGPTTQTPDSDATSTDTAIHIANTIVAGTTPLADASLTAAPSEYKETNGATTYPYYLRPDGSNRMKRLDLSVLVDSNSWDPQGGASPRNYPDGTRLVDALPALNIMASYVAGDNTVIPKPVCGNPLIASSDYSRARIFAMPLSTFDYTQTDAGTMPTSPSTTTVNYTQVPTVVTGVTLNSSGSGNTLNVTTTNNVNNIDPTSVNTTTLIDPEGLASSVWASTAGPTSNNWVFHVQRMSGQYGASATLNDGVTPSTYHNAPLAKQLPTAYYQNLYPVQSLIQTACYYGT